MNTHLTGGFTYTVEHVRNGEVLSTETVKNLMPLEGINHMLGVTFKGVTQATTWYIGLYEGNYTPVLGDTAAAFPAAATECTAYDESTRVEFNEGAVSGGALNNAANVAVFTMNATKTVYGGFVSSASAKGGISGVLGSAVRFASAKSLESGDLFRVTAGFTLASA